MSARNNLDLADKGLVQTMARLADYVAAKVAQASQ
jgi:hypothetical protein